MPDEEGFAGAPGAYRNRLFHYQTKLFYLSPQSRLRENQQYLADLEERFAEAMKARLFGKPPQAFLCMPSGWRDCRRFGS